MNGEAMRKHLLSSAAAVFYIAAGLLHFLTTDVYVRIVPPHVPWPFLMVYLSGAAEVAGGAGLLLPSVRRMASFGLIALLVAVFPANIYMAAKNIQVSSVLIPSWILWARLPIQGLLIWWLVAIIKRDPKRKQRSI